MAIVYDALVPPDDLTVFIRELPAPAEFTLSAAMPVVLRNTDTIDFGLEVVQRNRTAKFRAFDGSIHVSERDIGESKQTAMMAFSSSLTKGEYERLKLLYAQTGGTYTAGLVNAIYNDSEQLVREMRARIELAIGDILTDGVLTITENGLVAEADYGVPADQKITLAGATNLWTSTEAKILTNLLAWRDIYAKANGGLPGAIRTSLRVQALMQRNPEIVAAVHGTTSGRTRVNINELNDLLVSEQLPPLVATYDLLVDVDGQDTRVIPDDRLLFTPANLGDLGSMNYGPSATALELVGNVGSDLSFSDAPGIVGVIDKYGPPYREQILVDAVGLPIIKDARKLLTAKVA